MVIGSASLYLHGLPVDPQDIDILCDTETAIAFENQLASHRIQTQKFATNKFSSRFSQYKINDTPVEIMGDLLVNTPTVWINLWQMITEPQTIKLNGHNYIIPNISDQKKIYTLFGREKDQAILTMIGHS